MDRLPRASSAAVPLHSGSPNRSLDCSDNWPRLEAVGRPWPQGGSWPTSRYLRDVRPPRANNGQCRSGTPDRIRTCGLRLRRPPLYPAELRAPKGAGILAKRTRSRIGEGGSSCEWGPRRHSSRRRDRCVRDVAAAAAIATRHRSSQHLAAPQGTSRHLTTPHNTAKHLEAHRSTPQHGVSWRNTPRFASTWHDATRRDHDSLRNAPCGFAGPPAGLTSPTRPT